MTNTPEMVSIEKHRLDELRFYAFAGVCIIRVQQLHDYLVEPFSKLLNVSTEEASVVFASVWSFDRRCKVICRLLKRSKSDLVADWAALTKRIAKAEQNRDSIAHGSPVFHGGGIVLQVEDGVTKVTKQSDSYFSLQKPGQDDWTTELLLEEARKTEALQSDLYAFTRRLGGPTNSDQSESKQAG